MQVHTSLATVLGEFRLSIFRHNGWKPEWPVWSAKSAKLPFVQACLVGGFAPHTQSLSSPIHLLESRHPITKKGRQSTSDSKEMLDTEWCAGRPKSLPRVSDPDLLLASVSNGDGAIFPTDCLADPIAKPDRAGIRIVPRMPKQMICERRQADWRLKHHES